MEGIERIRAGPSQGGKKPEEMSPQELHAVLWQVLSFRDSVVKVNDVQNDRIHTKYVTRKFRKLSRRFLG
jgi:hypothetical protein